MSGKSLADIWERQRRQQYNWYNKDELPAEERAIIERDLILDLHSDIAKLQRTIGRDRYHILRRPPAATQDDIAEAGVDAFKMLMSVLQLHGVSCAQFVDSFYSKSDVVDNKWRCEQADLSQDVRVVCVDLDGCVTDWADGFISYCKTNGVIVHPSQVNEPRMEPIKDQFHGGGGFLTLRPIPFAVETIKSIRKLGYKTVVVTARPYHQFKRVYSDTMEWLKKHEVEYDHLMFENNKANAILRIRPAQVVGFIEDRGKHALEVALTGTQVFKLPHPVGGGENVEHPLIRKVAGWAEIFHHLKKIHEVENAAA